MFMPEYRRFGIWIFFAGKNNYEAADNGGSAGHKEINQFHCQ
jgi:sucrose phosphorylase